jgi:hemerythrin-like domain-containing protein
MSSATDVPLADATAMTRFHHIFREALTAAPRFVRGAAPGDSDRAELVGTYYDNVLRLLHAHHEAEDLTIYPWMLARLPEHADIFARMDAEHEAILGPLTAAEHAVAAWRTDPTETAREATATGLAELEGVLLRHLDDEEAEAVPLIGQCITVAEWGEMSGVAFQHFTGDKAWLVIGLIQEQMLPHENEAMEAGMPPPLREFWVGPGRSTFDDFVTRLRTAA